MKTLFLIIAFIFFFCIFAFSQDGRYTQTVSGRGKTEMQARVAAENKLKSYQNGNVSTYQTTIQKVGDSYIYKQVIIRDAVIKSGTR